MYSIASLQGGFSTVDTYPTVSTAAAQIVTADSRRAILYITNSTPSVLSIWHNPPAYLGGPAHILIPAGSTWRFTWSDDGHMPTLGWVGSLAAGSAQIAVVQVLWRPEQIAQSLGGL